MHVITGLPRSGSTLFCNILNQNPKFHASSTSCLPLLFAGMINTWSQQLEVKADLERDRKSTEARLARTLRGLCSSWYDNGDDKKVIFDKSRAWMHHLPSLRQAFTKSKVIVLVRDLRDVFASIEKQHLKNPILDEANLPNAKTQYGRADHLFSPAELVGGPLGGLKDIIDRKQDVFVVKFEDLASHAEEVLKATYEYLGEKWYPQHKYKSVKDTSTDPDGFYLFKYPHEGKGDVKPPKGHWSDHVAPDIAVQIVSRFPWFYQQFEYDATTNAGEPAKADADTDD